MSHQRPVITSYSSTGLRTTLCPLWVLCGDLVTPELDDLFMPCVSSDTDSVFRVNQVSFFFSA